MASAGLCASACVTVSFAKINGSNKRVEIRVSKLTFAVQRDVSVDKPAKIQFTHLLIWYKSSSQTLRGKKEK